MDIFRSASKLVFVAMAFATIALTAMGKVDAKDFITLVSMAFTYYFGYNMGTKNNTPSS